MGSRFDSVWVPNLTAAFVQQYEGTLDNMWSANIAKRIDSQGEFEKLVDVSTVGAIRQFSGPRQSTPVKPYTQVVQNVPFELTLEVDVEDVKRDNLGIWESRAEEIGSKFAYHIDALTIASILANPVCLDGTTYFGTSHSIAANVNAVTSSQVGALATAGTTPAAPTAVDMMGAILGVVTQFLTFTDEAGDPINGGARKFIFATSNPVIYASALTAINSMQLAGGQTDILSKLNAKGYSFDVTLDIRLGSSTSHVFYVFRTDHVIKPFVWTEEVAPQIQFSGEGSYNAIYYNKYIWAAKAVRNVATMRYQHAIKATLS